jgi:GNAT superfamily N-acetyltransferase
MNGTRPTHPAFAAETLAFRLDAVPDDRRRVREIAASTEFFSPEEVEIAVELLDDRLVKGTASEYQFVFADLDGRTVAFACLGRIPATQESFDLYWIAVRPDRQRRGVGRALLENAERLVRRRGGSRIYVDTSGREQYASTRAFYERAGYRREAVLRDFFAPGDDKAIFVKVLPLES